MAANISNGDTCRTVGKYEFNLKGIFSVCSKTTPPTWKEITLSIGDKCSKIGETSPNQHGLIMECSNTTSPSTWKESVLL